MVNENAELSPEKREHLVGTKLTLTEKTELENFCAEHKYDVSKFLRYSLKQAMKKKK